MKRKDILLKSYYQGIKQIKTIGVIGVHRGAGVTQTAFMLAVYFSEYKNYSTAFVECNTHKDMQSFELIYNWDLIEEDRLKHQQLMCYKNHRSLDIGTILNDGHHKIIIDFGDDLETNFNEFIRCDIKIVMCSQIEWKRIFLLDFLERYKNMKGCCEWFYFIPYGNKKIIKDTKGIIKVNINSIPFERDVTRLSKDTIKLFDECFGA